MYIYIGRFIIFCKYSFGKFYVFYLDQYRLDQVFSFFNYLVYRYYYSYYLVMVDFFEVYLVVYYCYYLLDCILFVLRCRFWI